MSDYHRLTGFLDNIPASKLYHESGPSSKDGGEVVDVTYFLGTNHLVLRYTFDMEGNLQKVEEV